MNSPPHPFCDLQAPHSDVPELDNDRIQKTTKKGKPKEINGYAGKVKGVIQILWERGLWSNNMKMKLDHYHPDYPDLSAPDMLINCENF